MEQKELKSTVLAVKLRRDKMVVVLRTQVHIFNLADLEFFGSFDTCDNPTGICALNSETETFVLAVPAVNTPSSVVI